MDLTKLQEKTLLRPLNLIYLLIGAVAVVGLTYVALNITRTHRAVEESALGEPLPASTTTDIYLVAYRADGINSLLKLDTASGRVEPIYEASPGSVMLSARDGRGVYVYDGRQPAGPEGRLALVDALDSSVVWEVSVPWFPWCCQPDQGLWLSTDGRRIYLLGAGDGLNPDIYTVEIETATLVEEFRVELPYPANIVGASPQAWKLPWADALIVASLDQLFQVDLEAGISAAPLAVFNPEDIERVPSNWSRGLYVRDGYLDPHDRRLYLAASSQEILAVDLTTEPIAVETVFSLPSGWQFAGLFSQLIVDAERNSAYIQVRRNETPRTGGPEVDEIWRMEMSSTWRRAERASLHEHGPFKGDLQRDQAAAPYSQSFDLGLFRDGNEVFTLTQRGLLVFGRQLSELSSGRWIDIEWEDIPELFWYALVP